QTLEHDPAIVDIAVTRQVDPSEATVGQTAQHLVLATDQVTLGELGAEGELGPTAATKTFRAAGAAVPAAADLLSAVAAKTALLRHHRIGHDRFGRVPVGHRGDLDHPHAAHPPDRSAVAAAGKGGTVGRADRVRDAAGAGVSGKLDALGGGVGGHRDLGGSTVCRGRGPPPVGPTLCGLRGFAGERPSSLVVRPWSPRAPTGSTGIALRRHRWGSVRVLGSPRFLGDKATHATGAALRPTVAVGGRALDHLLTPPSLSRSDA